jgi:radical SAM protein with 4Fe4S-binding SPASM domain
LNDEQISVLQMLDFPGLSIQVSLDGASARTHDLVRGEGAFRGAMHGIMKLVQAGLGQRTSIFFTEMMHNLGEIPELLDFADRAGIGPVVTGSIVMCGRASETSLVSPPDTEQYLGLLERYDNDTRFRKLYSRIGRVAALEWKAGAAARRECCTFIENPYLTPSGRLYPCLLCHADEYSVTGIFEKDLAAAIAEGIPLWSALLRVSRSRAEALPECHDCPGKQLCAGGCMGRALGSCGNILAADDRCDTRRTIYQQAAG